ncbi:MAG: right-handed parallel beta-helix repeat-containing protein [Verrucomicrobiaceae bacterium]|nr:right-handed parallel beta-helix repeat-containing protein [Verrucomicrobiaceae bacterium]
MIKAIVTFTLIATFTSVAAPVALDASKFPSLQAAFDALPAEGGSVNIPPGNYEITEPLRIQTPETRVVGHGAATHIINKSEAGTPALILEPKDLTKDPKSRLWRVQLADLRISGNPKSGDGIYAHFIQEIYLEGVSIDHHGANGVHLHSCFEDPRVEDSIFTYNATAGLQITDCHDIVVNGNHFEENQDALRCVDSFNLCCNGNNIDDHLRHGIVIENTYGSVCSGNMVEECNGTAVILDRDCYGITLSANVIAHHLQGGIDLVDANGCAVSANSFVLCHTFGVRLGKESGRNSITGNTFGNTYIGNGQLKRPLREHENPMMIDAAGGIVIEGASDLAITGNTFTGLDYEAVKSDAAATRLLVTQNIMTDCCRRLSPSSPWVKIASPEGNHLIKDNLGQK